MSPEREPLPASSNGSDFTDSERNDTKASTIAQKAVLSDPGELDVLMNNRKSTVHDESAGNRRMHGILVDYRPQYNSGTRTQKTRIVEKVLAEVSKGGARFLLQISGSGEEPIRRQEISPDDAAKCVEHELQTKGSVLVDGKRKRHKKKKSSMSPSYEQDPEGDQSDETYEEDYADDGRRKKPRYQPSHTSPFQQNDDIASLPRTSPRNSDLESGTRSMASRYTPTNYTAARLPLYVQSIRPTSGIPATAQQTTVTHLTTVANLLNVVVHHLSRAVSTAELLSYLHSVEAASARCTPEIYDAIAAAVELLRPTPTAATQHATLPPPNNPFPGQPSLSGIANTDSHAHRFHGIVAGNNVAGTQQRQGFHGTISNQQQLLDVVASLVPSVDSTGNDNENADRNQNQEVIRIINLLLQSLPQAPPSAS